MGDHHHGHAVVGQILHDLQHLANHFGVQGRGGLVKQHHIRLHAQGAGDGDTLLLTAGQLLRIGVGTVGQTDHIQKAAGSGFGLGLLDALGVHGCERQVLEHRHVGEQVKVLEHHAHPLAVQVDVHLFVGNVHVFKVDGTVGGLFQQVEGAQHGGFARAGGAYDDHHFALLDLQRAVVQSVDAVGEGLDQVFHPDQCITGCRHGASSFRRPR